MFSKLGDATIFSTINLCSGYYHIGLTRESRAKSALVVPMGKWQFKCTPFGLSQAPAYFQLLIDKVLMGCSGFAMGYLDDIIIFSKTEEEHLQHLEEIFIRLRKFGLKMKREKCSFFKKHIQFWDTWCQKKDSNHFQRNWNPYVRCQPREQLRR